MKKYHPIVVGSWIALSLLASILSYRLGLGTLHSPGPGLMPFITGTLLLIVSLYLLAASFLKSGEEQEVRGEKPGRAGFANKGLMIVSLFGYALLLERLGYLITTFLFLIASFRLAGSKGWGSALVTSTLVVVLTYFVFTSFGLRFPAGILQLR